VTVPAIHVCDGAVVIDSAVIPVSAIVAAPGVSEPVIDAAIEADIVTPVAGVPKI
jgi:hypothetical protein